MYLSEDYVSGQLHRAAEQRMLRDLERRRVIAERAAEDAAAADGVTDAARPRRGIRAAHGDSPRGQPVPIRRGTADHAPHSRRIGNP